MIAPQPQTEPIVGHLGRWAKDPLRLIEEGAAQGPVFSLRLWRRAMVGYSPEWNRFVLGDLDTFRSKGSMSGLSPYLAGGVVQTDAPRHRLARRELNPHFARRSVEPLASKIVEISKRRLPAGDFDAVVWSSAVVRDVLASTFFDNLLPDALLARFLDPLDRPLPGPFLRRPLLFRRMNQALAVALGSTADDTIGAAFRGRPDGVEQVRVALSAAYDTTAHTLAWLLFHVADNPEWLLPHRRDGVIDEVLRLYPAGWLGSRRCGLDTEFQGIEIKRGTLVLYSPYLTHRDPAQWKDPLTFAPERFEDPLPAWGFIPFSAGERTCLGASLARLVLDQVLTAFEGSELTRVGENPGARAGLTLAPSGPLLLRRTA
ncbi:MAG: cytochrome [Pseudonocardiales bacterium]|nr:cytochrome [Pseudonocardiales bacterium]